LPNARRQAEIMPVHRISATTCSRAPPLTSSGFLLKDVAPEHLVAAVQLVQTGDVPLAPSIPRHLVELRVGFPVGLRRT
jgi:DNA-binding NarL/FixJ family response regulator